MKDLQASFWFHTDGAAAMYHSSPELAKSTVEPRRSVGHGELLVR